MGDASENIPGVRGIGEKGAIKLVSEYTTIENIYANINNIKGATQTKLIEGEDDAYYSKDLVTIYREVPLDVSFDDLKYKNCNIEELTNIYKDLGFYSLLKKLDDVIEEDEKKEEHNSIDNFKVITDISGLLKTRNPPDDAPIPLLTIIVVLPTLNSPASYFGK